MNPILQHLDWVLDFHREYEIYWHPTLQDKDGNTIHSSEEFENDMKIYRARIAELAMKISKEEKTWTKYLIELYGILEEEKLVIYEKQRHHITLKGRMFEGFVNRQNRFQNEKERMKLLEERTRVNAVKTLILNRRTVVLTNRSVILTCVLVGGTILLLIWDFVKWYLDKYSVQHFHLFF